MIEWRSFEDARKFARKQKIQTISDWIRFSKSGKRPKDIPSMPNRTYKGKGWISWGDWLGITIIATQDRTYSSFNNARIFVQKLKLKSRAEWIKYCKSGKKPDDIPNNPWNTYKKQWKGMGDFLGSGTIPSNQMIFWPFKKSRLFARKLKLKSSTEWKIFCKSGKKPVSIPSAPDQKYKGKGWISWGDWLGTGRIQSNKFKYRQFIDAKKFVHKLRLTGSREWRAYCKSGKKPDDIPSNPNNTYKGKGWISWGDWFGTDEISTQAKSMQYLSPSEALPVFRKLAIEYGLKNKEDWKKFAKTHKNLLEKLRIPAYPLQVYSKENVWRKMKH